MIKINNDKFQSIKDVRSKIKKTQMDIAKAVFISESYYNLIENGKRNPSVVLSALVAKELGITLDNFFILYNFTKCQEKGGRLKNE